MTFASILAGQTISDEITQMFSPNAAELGKYGKIPVNHFSEQIKAMLFRHISKIVVTDSHGVRYTFGDDGGTLLGYTVEGLAIDSAATMLSVNYYDDHSFIGSYGFPQDLLFDEAITDDGYGDRLPSAQGTLTGSMSAVITSEGVSAEEFRHTALFYDEYGRAVQTVSRYGDGGMVRTAAAFDFTGNRILSREAVSLSDRCDTVERADAYDLWGRVRGTATGLSAGGGLHASDTVGYAYDGIGRLAGVTYGDGDMAVSETLAYNLRGWLTEKRSGVFGMRLRYNAPALGSAPCWSGGVSEWQWGGGRRRDAEGIFILLRRTGPPDRLQKIHRGIGLPDRLFLRAGSLL